ncbi:hypothetical protein ABC383_02115 [Noviherbaspirillum sp. 1P10PC]|uniref:hypothetical protein n=1 Tax=Noviherbaspirillum sp. 1P10PC TaxID=3132292 RepID=UPI0039A2A59D
MDIVKNNCFAFVIMPFSDDFNDTYKLGIKQVATECGVKAERLDEQIFDEGMLDRIFRQIDMSDFIIADLSTRNANVFYELGYAHAKEKICLLLTKDPNDIPFDLKHKRHIVYGSSISYLQTELRKNIEWAKEEARARSQNKIQVVARTPEAKLTKTSDYATATLDFVFDLHNKTDRVSPDISAVYLYAGNKWKLSAGGRECPYHDSDIKPYNYRYFIPSPTTRIGKDGWAQVSVSAQRTLAFAWRGDEIKDKYPLSGHGMLRLETSEGNIDQKFDFNVVAEDFPF